MSGPDSPATTREDLGFLSASSERLNLLLELHERSLSPAELGERAGVSDETVRKLLAAGIERDWITGEQTTERYRLTAAGALILQTYLNATPLSRELLAFLAASATRLRILDYLRDEPLSPLELNDHIPVSHPTVYRALHSLEERGLIDWTDTPELLPTGVDVYTAYRGLAAVVRWTATHAELVAHLGETARTIPTQTFVQSTPQTMFNSIAHPDAVLCRFEAYLEERSPERIHGLLPSICSPIDRLRRLFGDCDTELEVIVDEAVLEVARTSHPETLDAIVEDDSIELLVHPEKLQFGLAALDSSAFVFVYDDRSLIGCLEAVSDTFSTWALDTYRTYRRTAYLLDS